MVRESCVRSIPCLSCVITLDEAVAGSHEAIARCRIETVGGQPVHDEGMRIKGSAGFAVLPVLSTIQAAHQRPRLGRSEDAPGYQRIRGNPADMRCPRARRKAPSWCRGELSERSKLSPGGPTILRTEDRAWLSSCIDYTGAIYPFRRANSHRHHFLVCNPLAH